MSEPAFCGAVLKGEHWTSCTMGMPTLEEAIGLVRSHYKTDPANSENRKRFSEPEFRVYKSEDGGAIVEIGPDARNPMKALAVYKILALQWPSSPEVSH